jgi:hypothetical protein
MKRSPRTASILLCVLLGITGCASEHTTISGPQPVEDGAALLVTPPAYGTTVPTHLVLLAENLPDPWTLLQDYGAEVIVSLLSGGLAGVSGDLDMEAMLADARIRAVQTNGATVLGEPSDLTMAFFEGSFDGSTLGGRLEFSSLRLDLVHSRARGSGIRVAVLDTGVDPAHVHLEGRLEMQEAFGLGWPEELADGLDEDGDGLVDEAHGHGTHVAGIIATVAPEATLLPVRVLSSDGIGTAYELALGIRNAIERGAHVINLSISIDENAGVVRELLQDAHRRGIAIVAAAGNTGGAPTYPAAYDFVLGTAATDLDPSQIADFSARGLAIELAAPGTSVLSSYPGGGWAEASGSSMAAAVLSGALAIVRSSAIDIDTPRAYDRLTSTAIAILPEGSVEHGRIDVLRALRDPAPTRRRLLQPTTLNGDH